MPIMAARVIIPVANTRGQTGSAETHARSRLPASRKAVAKKVGPSGQEAMIEYLAGVAPRPPHRAVRVYGGAHD